MSAGLAADPPRHSRIAWFASNRVVSTLAISPTDRMNRWKIKHVEPTFLCVLSARPTIPEARSSIPIALCGSREKFIPRGEHCDWPINHDAGNGLVLRGIRAIRISRYQYFQLT